MGEAGSREVPSGHQHVLQGLLDQSLGIGRSSPGCLWVSLFNSLPGFLDFIPCLQTMVVVLDFLLRQSTEEVSKSPFVLFQLPSKSGSPGVDFQMQAVGLAAAPDDHRLLNNRALCFAALKMWPKCQEPSASASIAAAEGVCPLSVERKPAEKPARALRFCCLFTLPPNAVAVAGDSRNWRSGQVPMSGVQIPLRPALTPGGCPAGHGGEAGLQEGMVPLGQSAVEGPARSFLGCGSGVK